MSEAVRMILGQVFAGLAVVMTFISYQMKTPKKLLFAQIFSAFFIMISYFFLRAYSGMLLNVVCIFRNLIFCYKSVKVFSYKFWPYLLAACMIVLSAFSWEGPVTLLIMIALSVNTVVLSLDNNQLLRASILFTSSLVLIYNVAFQAYPAVINEGIAIVSSIIGLIRYSGKKEAE